MDKVVARVTPTGCWTVHMDADEHRSVAGTRGLQPVTTHTPIMDRAQRVAALAEIRYANRFKRQH